MGAVSALDCGAMYFPQHPTLAPHDVVDLLLDSHDRIREHLVLARKLSIKNHQAVAEVADAASRVRRYFAEAYPLHVQHEELDIGPRIATDADGRRDLARIRGDHMIQASLVEELVALCRIIADAPAELPRYRIRLDLVVERLATELGAHLVLVERTVIPRLRVLPASVLAEIRADMERRRR